MDWGIDLAAKWVRKVRRLFFASSQPFFEPPIQAAANVTVSLPSSQFKNQFPWNPFCDDGRPLLAVNSFDIILFLLSRTCFYLWGNRPLSVPKGRERLETYNPSNLAHSQSSSWLSVWRSIGFNFEDAARKRLRSSVSFNHFVTKRTKFHAW